MMLNRAKTFLRIRIDDSLEEAKFNNLCSHYKDSYDAHLVTVKQRDTLFYMLLIIMAIFSLQSISIDSTNEALSQVFKQYIGISLDKGSSVLSTLIWFALFGFTTRYYQVVIQIEGQYNYLHKLEETLNGYYKDQISFTREGKSYSKNTSSYFSEWIYRLYTWIFPVLILLLICLKIFVEFTSILPLSCILSISCILSLSNILISLIFFVIVLISTILYLVRLHSS